MTSKSMLVDLPAGIELISSGQPYSGSLQTNPKHAALSLTAEGTLTAAVAQQLKIIRCARVDLDREMWSEM